MSKAKSGARSEATSKRLLIIGLCNTVQVVAQPHLGELVVGRKFVPALETNAVAEVTNVLS